MNSIDKYIKTEGLCFMKKSYQTLKQHFDYRLKEMVEAFMIGMVVLGSIATIPTLIKIWYTHHEHASGQSIITWSFYALIALLWLIYGICYRHISIWVTNSVYLVFYILIVIGILRNAGFTW